MKYLKRWWRMLTNKDIRPVLKQIKSLKKRIDANVAYMNKHDADARYAISQYDRYEAKLIKDRAKLEKYEQLLEELVDED